MNAVTEIWSGYAPLIKAAKAGKINSLELLLKSGADVNRIDTRGSSALIKAAARSAGSCVTALIKAGADVNVVNDAGETAVLHCARNSIPVDELIEAGADVNIWTKDKGSTALLEAVQIRKKVPAERILNSLIQAGADVNAASHRNSKTALMISVQGGYMSRIRLLLKGGCKVNLLDNNDKNVFNYLQHFIQAEKGRKTRDVTKRRMFSLLAVAGAQIHQPTTELFMYFFEDVIEEHLYTNLCLKDICRRTIRSHLLDVNADGNLFVLVPRLGLPSILAAHLLHCVSLDGVKKKKSNAAEKATNTGLIQKVSRSRKRRATKRWRKRLNLRKGLLQDYPPGALPSTEASPAF